MFSSESSSFVHKFVLTRSSYLYVHDRAHRILGFGLIVLRDYYGVVRGTSENKNNIKSRAYI